MSQFDCRSTVQYTKQLRAFLGKQHPASAEFLQQTKLPLGHVGRGPKLPDAAVDALEAAVNAKAERCEADDTSFVERYVLARDYRNWNDGEVARAVSLSREAVRKWRMGNTKPTRLDDLAKALNVPLRWLKQGGMQHLPADSHLGVKVGKMAMDCREKLMGLTTSIISQHLHDDDADGSGLRELSDKLAREDAQLSRLARQAGGRWLFVSGELVFAPWVSVEPYQLSRHLWSPEVERIISEELASQRSVYAAWFAVKHRCEDSKLAYPRKITLYKRVRNAQLRAIRFGVNLSTLGC